LRCGDEFGTDQQLRILRDGFFLQGANPKALLFFTLYCRSSSTAPLGCVADTDTRREFDSGGIIILFVSGELAGRALLPHGAHALKAGRTASPARCDRGWSRPAAAAADLSAFCVSSTIKTL